MKNIQYIIICALSLTMFSCKKKGCTDSSANNFNMEAKKDDGSCTFNTIDSYPLPSSYQFSTSNGNSTVDYSGQTQRLDQLSEMISIIENGATTSFTSQQLLDMFMNTNGNGNGNFTFTSTKQLKDKCATIDQLYVEDLLSKAATASLSNGMTASNGQAGILTSGTSTYLFDANGRDVKEMVEKAVMGGVFMYQALNVYFGANKMSAQNTTAVDAPNGKFYTDMQHHWDEAFGYFGVPADYPNTLADRFWGEYSNKQQAIINSDVDMMYNFKRGRVAINYSYIAERDIAIANIRKEWEDINAYQAMAYLDQALTYFGNDNAKFLHVMSEVYGFAWNLRYSPVETQRMTVAERDQLMQMFPTNFWNITVQDINAIKNTLNAKY